MSKDTPQKKLRKNSVQDRDPNYVLQQLPADEIARVCGVDVRTARKWKGGISKPPYSAVMLLVMHANALLGGAEEDVFISSRSRAAGLRVRMLQFHSIYNAAWFVRWAEHGSAVYRRVKMDAFADVLRKELESCQDNEALLYAVADALTAYPRGCPWER